jgi:pyruvate-ferredoxin/flavodoxin oxidoreductase
VASVSRGADPEQLVRAVTEAEAYPGPSVVIAYTPCTAHGIKIGMGRMHEEEKRAVVSGYWPLYRYDPRLEHPFALDYDPATATARDGEKITYRDFLEGEVRYSSLDLTFPENAKTLFAKAEGNAGETMRTYAEMAHDVRT